MDTSKTAKPLLALVAVAMATLCLTGATANAQTLVGLWRFDGDFVDSSIFGNDGTPMNGVTLTAGQAGFGQAADFSGNDTHVLVPHHASLNMASAVTMAAWVNADGNAWEGILAKNPSNGSNNNQAGNYELRLETGSENIQALYQTGGVNDTVTDNSETSVPTGSWHHVAVSIDGTGATEIINYYLDGVLVDSDTTLDGFGATNTNPLYIGSRADLFTDFHGQLDDVALFEGILDETQIGTIGTGDFTAFGVGQVVPEPTSIAMWSLIGLGLAGFGYRRFKRK